MDIRVTDRDSGTPGLIIGFTGGKVVVAWANGSIGPYSLDTNFLKTDINWRSQHFAYSELPERATNKADQHYRQQGGW